ncbi:MAG: glycosyltransferase family 1 protein [Methylococcales bacterium]|nr:glycosyltransferase family 1 protein [Methylococcales bacterium]
MLHWLQNIALNHLPVSLLRDQVAKLWPQGREDKQLLIDMSVISEADAGTGIQRVVRNIYQELLAAPPAGYKVCPVTATRNQSYQYLPVDFLQDSSKTREGLFKAPVQVCGGDLFLGLDLAAHIIPHHLADLFRWKRQGVRFCFFVYDLLPILEPSWFTPKTANNFRRWLRALAILADDVVTISQIVRVDFGAWMQKNWGISEYDLPCSVIQLGADINASHPKIDLSTCLPPQLLGRKFILMVGTIEPRKGHADVLDAFDEFWKADGEAHLVIVGKQGWKMLPFLQRLQAHSETGKRLLWLNGPSDEVLLALYQTCSGLIMGSKGEGLGLPLIEVACFNKPVLARDIPVFREIAGDNVTFFPNLSASELPKILTAWIDKLGLEGNLLSSRTSGITWKESCLQLVKILSGSFHQREMPVALTPILGPTAPLYK